MKYKMSEILISPPTKLRYFPIKESWESRLFNQSIGIKLANVSMYINTRIKPKEPTAAMTWLWVREEMNNPMEIKAPPNKSSPRIFPTILFQSSGAKIAIIRA